MSGLGYKIVSKGGDEEMGTTERRNEILKVLCRRGYETAGNLAFEFGVSERTVRRDIEVLSRNNPIYTKSGGHAGGIYIVGGYSPDRMYMSDAEIYVLKKLYTATQADSVLTADERKILESLISLYSKPKTKGRKK